jgi:hypothetical protein
MKKPTQSFVKKYSPRWWRQQITQAEERRSKFIKDAEESIRVYNAQKQVDTLKDAQRRLNVWWYCINTLLPAYYSSTPKAEVNLRKRAGSLPYELGSVILERNTQYSMDCHFDFDRVGYNAALQFLLTGQAVLWARYEPKFQTVFQEVALMKLPDGTFADASGNPFSGEIGDVTEAPGGLMITSVQVEQKISEKAILEVVQYNDYFCSDARNESEIQWQARRAFLDRDQATTLFGEEKADTLSYDSFPDVAKKDLARSQDKFDGKAEVFEIWCEATNRVYWIQKSGDQLLLDETEPPIKFEKFYPCTVIRQSLDPDSIVPVSDYAHVKDQILEVERLTTRIHAVTQAIRTNFAYDAAMGTTIEQIFQDDLKGVPVTNWPSNQSRGGLQAAMNFYPVEPFINALNVLQGARQTALQQLYETLKVSDLLRGTSEQYKSATANRLENQWSSLGLIVRQNMFSKFVSDAISNLGTIIAEQFDEETILDVGDADTLISQVLPPTPPLPPALPPMMPPQMPQYPGALPEEPQGMPEAPEGMEAMMPGNPEAALEQMEAEIISILRDNKKRSYRIEIASDSMVAIDQQQQQQEGINLMQVAGQFFDQMRGLVDQYPPLAEFSISLFQNMIKRFKGGKEIDGIFTKALTQIGEIAKAKEEAAKQPPPPDPTMQEVQGRLQIAQIEAQTRLQQAQMESQDKSVKNQIEIQNQQLKAQRDQLDAQLAVQQQQFNEFIEQQKLGIAQQEAQIKAQAVQVDMLKIESSAKTETDKTLVKQETSQMQHILDIQKLELENMRVRLAESEKLLEERRLKQEQDLERVRLTMEQLSSSTKVLHEKTFAPKPKRKVGKIISDNIGNPVGIEIIEQGENEEPMQRKIGTIVNDNSGNPLSIEFNND